jgi:hypothetical protein
LEYNSAELMKCYWKHTAGVLESDSGLGGFCSDSM